LVAPSHPIRRASQHQQTRRSGACRPSERRGHRFGTLPSMTS